jgi:hypothetical protein
MQCSDEKDGCEAHLATGCSTYVRTVWSIDLIINTHGKTFVQVRYGGDLAIYMYVQIMLCPQ